MTTLYGVQRPSRIVNNALPPLAHSVARFCDMLVREPANDRLANRRRADRFWLQDRAYEIRDHLVRLGTSINNTRTPRLTRIQTCLRDLQLAYRTFQGLMIGVPDHLLDHGESVEQVTIRQLLLGWLDFYQDHAPLHGAKDGGLAGQVNHVSDKIPSRLGRRAAAGPPSTVLDASLARESVSMLFERTERVQRSMVAMLSARPDMPAPLSRPSESDIEAELSRLQTHLKAQQPALQGLLTRTGHRRTDAMYLGHEVFQGLGHVEGAMIGREPQYQVACQIIANLVDARTNELCYDY
ncbi:hypothetical protein GCM10023165_37110 [Variovorax defluvii]|uniref:Uncharacterized protein n=1 Tax=Variovorax defluvii TaxID=913761 RepID=A0ABP8I2E0_9BURK